MPWIVNEHYDKVQFKKVGGPGIVGYETELEAWDFCRKRALALADLAQSALKSAEARHKKCWKKWFTLKKAGAHP